MSTSSPSINLIIKTSHNSYYTLFNMVDVFPSDRRFSGVSVVLPAGNIVAVSEEPWSHLFSLLTAYCYQKKQDLDQQRPNPSISITDFTQYFDSDEAFESMFGDTRGDRMTLNEWLYIDIETYTVLHMQRYYRLHYQLFATEGEWDFYVGIFTDRTQFILQDQLTKCGRVQGAHPTAIQSFALNIIALIESPSLVPPMMRHDRRLYNHQQILDCSLKNAVKDTKSELHNRLVTLDLEVMAKTKEVEHKTEEFEDKTKEVKAKDREIKAKTKEVKAKEREVKAKEREIKAKTREIDAKTQQIKALTRQVDAMSQSQRANTTRTQSTNRSENLQERTSALARQSTRLGEDESTKDDDLPEIPSQFPSSPPNRLEGEEEEVFSEDKDSREGEFMNDDEYSDWDNPDWDNPQMSLEGGEGSRGPMNPSSDWSLSSEISTRFFSSPANLNPLQEHNTLQENLDMSFQGNTAMSRKRTYEEYRE